MRCQPVNFVVRGKHSGVAFVVGYICCYFQDQVQLFRAVHTGWSRMPSRLLTRDLRRPCMLGTAGVASTLNLHQLRLVHSGSRSGAVVRVVTEVEHFPTASKFDD